MHSGFRVIWDSHVRGFQISFVRVFWVVSPKESDMNFPRAFAAISCVFVFVGIDVTAIAQEGIVVGWGSNAYGKSIAPTDLGPCTQIAAGSYHTAVIQLVGNVKAWGYNSHGQTDVPTGLGACTQIAGGERHTVALREDGIVRAWGIDVDGQCSIPSDLGVCTQIASGLNHTIALTQKGVVRTWGNNWAGQCNIPSDLGVCTQIAAGDSHTIAIQQSGLMRAWGWNGNGQCDIPSDLGVCTQIAGGAVHTIALTGDGIVRAWGSNGNGQCNIPSNLGPCRKIAGASNHTIALRQDGIVRAWGYNTEGQCSIPSDLGVCTQIATASNNALAIKTKFVMNTRTAQYYSQLIPGISNAENGDILLVDASTLGEDSVDYRGKSIELKSAHAILRPAISTTLFANGARMTAPESIKIDGVVNIPTNVGITITTSSTLAFAGNTFVSLGGSVMAQNDGSPVQLDGSMILATNAVFNALAPISLNGSLDLLGGILIADNFSTASESTFVSVGGTIDVGLLTMGGDASCLASTIVADVAVSASSQLAASGQIIGAIDNSGRILTTDDLVVIGNIHNKTTGTILAQVGVLYVTGQLMNEGIVIGNVITTPGFAGGGTGGTQPGDGIRVAGSVSVGTGGELRFIEELWKFSLCGDMTIACPASKIQFQGAELSFDGCDSTTQSFEVTSRDFGCVAGPFEGGAADVSLFGEIAIHTGSTVALVDAFHNTAGKGSEVLYAKGLHVFPGATLMTNGHKVYTSNANIQGSVDDPSNICELPYNPNPDINGDGYVNGIDLAYILVYWSTGTAVADLNRDGIVSGLDLAIMMGAWQP